MELYYINVGDTFSNMNELQTKIQQYCIENQTILKIDKSSSTEIPTEVNHKNKKHITYRCYNFYDQDVKESESCASPKCPVELVVEDLGADGIMTVKSFMKTHNHCLPFDVHLQHHVAMLRRMCRVCGTHSANLAKNAIVQTSAELAKEASFLGVDVSNDDPEIYPFAICERCKKIAAESESKQAIPSVLVKYYEFTPHTMKECKVCAMPCSACMLVQKSSEPHGKSPFWNCKLTDEQAIEIRHKILVKSILSFKHGTSNIQVSSKLLPQTISDVHEDPCTICQLSCPMCGLSLKNAGDMYAIRCKQTFKPSSRVLRPRKRKVVEEEPLLESPKIQKISSKLTREPKVVLPRLEKKPVSIAASNVITILSREGQSYKVPLVNGKQMQPVFVKNGVASGRVVAMVNPQQMQPSVTVNPKLLFPAKQVPRIFPKTSFINSESSSISLPTSRDNKLSVVSYSSSAAAAPSVVKTVSTQPTHFKQVSALSDPRSRRNIKIVPAKARFSRPALSQQQKLVAAAINRTPGTPDSVEFGFAPRKVAEAFHESYAKHGSLTACIRSALSAVPLLQYKYRFLPQDLPSSRNCILIGLVSSLDDREELIKELKRLDKYVRDNHLRSRASALEELLYSPAQHKLDHSESKAIVVEAQPLKKFEPIFFGNDGETTRNFNIVKKANGLGEWWCKICKKKFLRRYRLERHFKSGAHRSRVHGLKKYKKLLMPSKTDKVQNETNKAGDGNIQPGKKIDQPLTYSESEKVRRRMFLSLDDLSQSLNKSYDQGNDQHVIKVHSGTNLGRLSDFTGVIPQHYKPYCVYKQNGQLLTITCNFCGFDTKDFNMITFHARKHVGDYPYRCAKCVFGSVSKSLLINHQSITGHGGFYVIKRSVPLTMEERKRLDAFKRLPSKFNKKGYINDFSRMEPQFENRISKYVHYKDCKEDETSNSAEGTSGKESNLPTNESGDADNSWLFCKLCNSAFLDKETYESHALECGTERNSKSISSDPAISNQRIKSSEEEVKVVEASSPKTEKKRINSLNVDHYFNNIRAVAYQTDSKKAAKLEDLSEKLFANQSNNATSEAPKSAVNLNPTAESHGDELVEHETVSISRRSRAKQKPQKFARGLISSEKKISNEGHIKKETDADNTSSFPTSLDQMQDKINKQVTDTLP